MHYYQFNIKTYIASTAHLTNGEDLAYRRLIDHYYDTELPIPTALPLLCRRLRLALPDVESVLNEFFIECEDGWRHSYIDNEIKAYKTFIARQKANGSKGGRASNANANPPLAQTEPTAKPTSNNKPITNNHKPIKKDKSAPLCVAVSVLVEKGFDEQTAEEFIAHKTKIKAPLTARAWTDHLSESEKAGWTPKAAAEKVMAKNWKCFEAKYVANESKQGAFTPAITTPSREAIDPIMAMAIQESARTFKPVTEIYKSMKNKALGVAA